MKLKWSKGEGRWGGLFEKCCLSTNGVWLVWCGANRLMSASKPSIKVFWFHSFSRANNSACWFPWIEAFQIYCSFIFLCLTTVASGVMQTPKWFKWIKSSVMYCRVTFWHFLGWFLSIALHIPLVHDFHVISASKWVRQLHIHNVRGTPQAKLDSEFNAHFLLNKHHIRYLLHCIKLVFNSFPFHWMSKKIF